MTYPIWNKTASKPKFKPLSGDAKTDVLVVGGGIAGLLCAHSLKEAGVDCMVLEAEEICGGTTGRTTAKITCQHGLIYDRLIRKYGTDTAAAYLAVNKRAVDEYRRICGGIDCGFEDCDSFIYSVNDLKAIERELYAIASIGGDADFCDRLPVPVKTCGAVTFRNQAQFDPLRFLYAIAETLDVREHTRVLEVRGNTAFTEKGTVRAERIVTATHFPFMNRRGVYFMKLYQYRSYVLAIEGAGKLLTGADGRRRMLADEDKKGLSFRSVGDTLLLGGGGHRTGKGGGCYGELSEAARKYYPSHAETGRWAAQDCMSLDSMPYIGKYSKNNDRVLVMTGFNKWGMTWAMAGSEMIRDEILGRKNVYARVFSPQRKWALGGLAENCAETTVNVLKPRGPRCPHMYSALNYNEEEGSWDCACHGSRFSAGGRLLDGPATGDKTVNGAGSGDAD